MDRTPTLKNHRPYSPAPILEGLGARQIAKLLNDGVRLSEIIRAVSEIRKWLPDAGLSAVRLHAGVLSDVQVEQPGGRTEQVWPVCPGSR